MIENPKKSVRKSNVVSEMIQNKSEGEKKLIQMSYYITDELDAAIAIKSGLIRSEGGKKGNKSAVVRAALYEYLKHEVEYVRKIRQEGKN